MITDGVAPSEAVALCYYFFSNIESAPFRLNFFLNYFYTQCTLPRNFFCFFFHVLQSSLLQWINWSATFRFWDIRGNSLRQNVGSAKDEIPKTICENNLATPRLPAFIVVNQKIRKLRDGRRWLTKCSLRREASFVNV